MRPPHNYAKPCELFAAVRDICTRLTGLGIPGWLVDAVRGHGREMYGPVAPKRFKRCIQWEICGMSEWEAVSINEVLAECGAAGVARVLDGDEVESRCGTAIYARVTLEDRRDESVVGL